MESSPTKHINQARKNYVCDWCYEKISKGFPYSTWFTYGENVTARMHPECYEASLIVLDYGEELPPAGTYKRGVCTLDRVPHE